MLSISMNAQPNFDIQHIKTDANLQINSELITKNLENQASNCESTFVWGYFAQRIVAFSNIQWYHV